MASTRRLKRPHGQQQHTAAHSAVVPPATSASRELLPDEDEGWVLNKGWRLFDEGCRRMICFDMGVCLARLKILDFLGKFFLKFLIWVFGCGRKLVVITGLNPIIRIGA